MYELNEIVTDYLGVDFDVASDDMPEIVIMADGTEDATHDAEAVVDTSVIGMSDDRNSLDDTLAGNDSETKETVSAAAREHSIRHAARIVRVAEAMGVIISPEQALRAGKIASGEIVVNTYFRAQATGRAQESPKVQANEIDHSPMTMQNDEPAEQSETANEQVDDMLNGGIEIKEESSPEPTANTDVPPDPPDDIPPVVPSPGGDDFPDEESNSGVEEITDESIYVKASGGTPAVEIPEEGVEEVDSPPGPHPRFASGQLRPTLRNLNEALTTAGVNAEDLLPPRMKEALPLMLDPKLSNSQIAEALTVQPSDVSKTAHRIIDSIIRKVPEGVIPDDLIQPTGPLPPSEPSTNVGGRLNEIRKAHEVTIDSLSEALDVSRRSLHRFFAGDAHPSSTHLLIPLLRELGVAEDQVAMFLDAYRDERSQRGKRQ